MTLFTDFSIKIKGKEVEILVQMGLGSFVVPSVSELFGPFEGSLGAKMRAQGIQKQKFRTFKEPRRVPKSKKRAR